MTAIQPTSSQSIALPDPDFESLVQVVEKTVTASSARLPPDLRPLASLGGGKHVIAL